MAPLRQARLRNVRLEVFLFEIAGKDVVAAGLVERVGPFAATELRVATDRGVLDPQRVGTAAKVDVEIAERCTCRSFGRNRNGIVAPPSPNLCASRNFGAGESKGVVSGGALHIQVSAHCCGNER